MISARRYAEAGAAFETFLAQFPTSPLADNAQYWLAETLLRARSIRRGAARVPQGPRAVSAVGEAARCAAEGRLLPDRARRPQLRRARRCRRSCASSPTRRPRGSRRSGSRACRARETPAVAAAAEQESAARAAQDHRDLLLDPGRSRVQRLADRVRAPHGLPAALPVLRHGVRVHGRRVAHVRRDRSRSAPLRHALRLRDGRRAARAAALHGVADGALRCGVQRLARDERRDRHRGRRHARRARRRPEDAGLEGSRIAIAGRTSSS